MQYQLGTQKHCPKAVKNRFLKSKKKPVTQIEAVLGNVLCIQKNYKICQKIEHLRKSVSIRVGCLLEKDDQKCFLMNIFLKKNLCLQ